MPSRRRKPITGFYRLRWKVLKRDKFTCQYCGQKAPDVVLEVDHRTPVSYGGRDEEDNLITSCQECNRGKGAWIGPKPTIFFEVGDFREAISHHYDAAQYHFKEAARLARECESYHGVKLLFDLTRV